jgi:hypothetical protein
MSNNGLMDPDAQLRVHEPRSESTKSLIPGALYSYSIMAMKSLSPLRACLVPRQTLPFYKRGGPRENLALLGCFFAFGTPHDTLLLFAVQFSPQLWPCNSCGAAGCGRQPNTSLVFRVLITTHKGGKYINLKDVSWWQLKFKYLF